MNNKQTDIEVVLWATRIGNEDWQEELITAAPKTKEGSEKIAKATAWAKNNGFDRIRTSENNANVAPDFSKTIKV